LKNTLQLRGFSLKVIIILNKYIKSLKKMLSLALITRYESYFVARMKRCCCFELFIQGEIGKKFYVVLEGKTAAFSRIKKIEKENLFKLAIMRMLFEIIRSELSINPL